MPAGRGVDSPPRGRSGRASSGTCSRSHSSCRSVSLSICPVRNTCGAQRTHPVHAFRPRAERWTAPPPAEPSAGIEPGLAAHGTANRRIERAMFGARPQSRRQDAPAIPVMFRSATPALVGRSENGSTKRARRSTHRRHRSESLRPFSMTATVPVNRYSSRRMRRISC